MDWCVVRRTRGLGRVRLREDAVQVPDDGQEVRPPVSVGAHIPHEGANCKEILAARRDEAACT